MQATGGRVWDTHGHRPINGTCLHYGGPHRPTCSTSLTDTHKHAKQPSLRMSSDFPDLLNGWVTELSLHTYLHRKITKMQHNDGIRGLSDSWKWYIVIWVTPQNSNCASNCHQTTSSVLSSIPWYCTRKIISRTMATTCQTVRCHESDVWFGCKWRGGLLPNADLYQDVLGRWLIDTGRKRFCVQVQRHLIFQDQR